MPPLSATVTPQIFRENGFRGSAAFFRISDGSPKGAERSEAKEGTRRGAVIATPA